MESTKERLAGLSGPERFAALAVERATGAVATAFDVEGRQGAYDVTLSYRDGRTAAVEVTSHAGPGRRQLEGILAADDFKWSNPGAWAWTVSVSDPTDLLTLRRVYGQLVTLCERHGVARPHLLPWTVRKADDAVRWLEESSSATMFGSPSVPARDGVRRRPVYVLRAGDGGAVGEALTGLDQAVAELLGAPSVARRAMKVGKVDADERHLFVAVDGTGLHFPVAAALVDQPERLPPTSTLTLPDRLTHLWLAPRYLNVLLGWTAADGGGRTRSTTTRRSATCRGRGARRPSPCGRRESARLTEDSPTWIALSRGRCRG